MRRRGLVYLKITIMKSVGLNRVRQRSSHGGWTWGQQSEDRSKSRTSTRSVCCCWPPHASPLNAGVLTTICVGRTHHSTHRTPEEVLKTDTYPSSLDNRPYSSPVVACLRHNLHNSYSNSCSPGRYAADHSSDPLRALSTHLRCSQSSTLPASYC